MEAVSSLSWEKRIGTAIELPIVLGKKNFVEQMGMRGVDDENGQDERI
ncbi:MAG: hypothetical protein J6K41_03460 [Paraprevotella sp.]|nr:hypothetical protein [Paraprevotella sp.]